MERADEVDRKARCLLEDVDDLRAIFADDVDIVTAGRIEVVFFKVDLVCIDVADRTELAKGIGTEEDVIRQVIGHDDFRPMDHRRFDELQGMFAQSQLVPFLDGDIAVPSWDGGRTVQRA